MSHNKSKIDSNRKTSISAGALIILGMVAGILSIVPSVESIDYLSLVSNDKPRVLTGAVFQFLLIPIYIGFALLVYPILRKYKENLALGFVGFRIIAGVFQLIGVILLPLFIFLSQEYLKSETTYFLYFETLGSFLKLSRDLVNHLGVMVATGLGNLILYYICFKIKILPKWVIIWGLFGNGLAIISSFLLLFGSIQVISTSFVLMTFPLVLQEIILAIWLIRIGFYFPQITNNDTQ